MAVSPRKITIIGCGPGSPDYLTQAARKAVKEARSLFGASRLLDLFPESTAPRIPVGRDVEGALAEIAARYEEGGIAVLVTGDPGLCSLAQPVLRRFGIESCEVIPAVSSVQVAFARLGMDWSDAQILSAHDRNPDVDAKGLDRCAKIAVLAGREESLPWVAGLLRGLGKGRRVFCCENLTLPDERIQEFSPSDVERLSASSRTIILIIRSDILP